VNPYEFSGAYEGCYADPGGAMDKRHVYTVHDILAAWPFQNALELGSYRGASSTAFIEAINGGAKMTATFSEIAPLSSLHEVIGNCRHPERVRLTKEPSWNVLESFDHFDFVLVDAYHGIAPVKRELQGLLVRRPLCIMAHDTNATDAGYEKAEGAKLLGETIRGLPGYFGFPLYDCIEDAKRRNGEGTERGLFFATTDNNLFKVARRAFDKWCPRD
jgi:hypothetical protein